MRDDSRRYFDFGPDPELQQQYDGHLRCQPATRVLAEDVPPELRDLIPFAERWAIPCDVARQTYLRNQPEADVREFVRVISRREKRINDWLEAPEEGWAEARRPFLYLIKAWCEAASKFPEVCEFET
jgi:hypothetical protein